MMSSSRRTPHISSSSAAAPDACGTAALLPLAIRAAPHNSVIIIRPRPAAAGSSSLRDAA